MRTGEKGPSAMSEEETRRLVVLVVGPDCAERRRLEKLFSEGSGPSAPALEVVEGVPEALALFGERDFDVCFCDSRVGEEALLRLVRSQRSWRDRTPIVVLAREEDELATALALAEGAEEFLAWDEVRRGILLRTLRYALGRQRDARELRRLSRRYKALTERGTAAFFRAGLDGRLLDANPALAKLLGYDSKEELLALPGPVLHPYLSPGRSEPASRVIPFGGLDDTVWLARRDGSRVHVLLSAEPVEGDPPNPIVFEGFVLEVPGGRAAATPEESAFKDALLETVEAGVLAVDPKGRVTVWSSGAERIVGVPASEMVGRPLAETGWRPIHENGLPLEVGDLPPLPALADGVPRRDELLALRRPDGKLAWVRSISRPLLVPGQNQPQGAVVAFTDRSEARVLAQQLFQAQRAGVLGRFAGSVAHDFNNLLTAILGYSDLLRRGMAAEDPQRSMVEEILKAAKRAAGLTGQLLAFLRRRPSSVQSVDLDSSVASMRDLVQRLVGQRIEVRFELAAAPGRLLADPTQVEQAILNLVVNARDALPEGGWLALKSWRAERPLFPAQGDSALRVVALEVIDNGSGMSEETIRDAFQPFFTTKEVGKGTGLGLAIVDEVMRASGGAVEIESQTGSGTTVRLLWPEMGEARPDE